MRKLLVLLATISLVTGVTASPATAHAASAWSTKAKIAKPSAPTIKSISSSTVKKGKVNVKVTISLPASNGGSKISGSKVSLGSKTCTIAKTKTSCTIYTITKGTALSVYANSKNAKGFSAKSARVTYIAGASSWSSSIASPAAPASVVSDTPAAVAPAPAPVAVVSCAAGGTCIMGDSGPGGGTVYYVDNSHSGFNCGPTMVLVCHYLEVAPSGWITGSSSIVWATGDSTSGNSVTGVPGISVDTSAAYNTLGLGLGYKNSDLIVTQNGAYSASDNNYTAGAARAYSGNSKTDWYLPTTSELNLLCQWNRNVTQNVASQCIGGTINTGASANSPGFLETYYFSSSQSQDDSYAWTQDFRLGGTWMTNKATPALVRPIRAF